MLIKSMQSAAEFMSGRGAAIALIAAIVCGSVIGILSPEAGSSLSDHIDFTVLFLVSLLLSEVRLQNIINSFNNIPFLLTALAANFVIIPALGYFVSSVFLSNHPLFFVGLCIYFMAPCTDWFLGFTRLAKGNTGLGAALLPINMLVQLLLYPVYLKIFGVEAAAAGVENIFQSLWQWFVIPLLMALLLRTLAERVLSEHQFNLFQSAVSITVPLLLAVLVWQISAANIGTLMANAAVFPLIMLGIMLFFTVTYFLSELISKVMKLPYEDRVLMTMTTAARNAPLMLALTTVVVPDQPIIYAAIIIGMLVELPHLVALKVILTRQRAAMKSDVPSFG